MTREVSERTNMAKAKKLPSGNWRVQLFVGTDENGKRKYESFTATTAKAAELMAAQRASELEQGIDKKRTPDKLTVGECVDIYIESREGLRVDKTIKDYRGYRRNYLQGLMPMRLKALTVQKIQREINLELEEHSPKTVRNAWGLISSALQYENEDLKFPVSLPPADGEEINLIEEEDLQRLLWRVKGMSLELPVKLAAMCGLRRGEIAALNLRKDVDYKRSVLHITKAATKNKSGEWILKEPKTPGSVRWVEIPHTLLSQLAVARDSGYCFANPDTISHSFVDIRDEMGLEVRFHDLRHFYATTLLELGASYHYVARRMGHKSASMIEKRYGHVTRKMEAAMNSRIDEHFGAVSHGISHGESENELNAKIV